MEAEEKKERNRIAERLQERSLGLCRAKELWLSVSMDVAS